jgi:hypothetical protein
MGLMWVRVDVNGFSEQYLRHTSDQNEGLAGSDWQTYDPRTGGIRTIHDVQNQVDVTTELVKSSGDEACCEWAVRVSVTPGVDAAKDINWLMVFYIGTEERNPTDESFLVCHDIDFGDVVNCYGNQRQLQNFTLHVRNLSNRDDESVMTHQLSLRSDTVPADGIWQAEGKWRSTNLVHT